MALKVRNGSSAWDTVSAIKIRNGSSAWVSATAGKIWNGTAWVEFFGALGATLPDQDPGLYSINIPAVDDYGIGNPAIARAILTLSPDGTGKYEIFEQNGAGVNVNLSSSPFTWKTGGGTAADYYAFLDTPTGDALNPLSSAVNTSLQLNTERVWYLSDIDSIGNGTPKECNSIIRIKNVSGTDLVAKSIYFYAYALAYVGG